MKQSAIALIIQDGLILGISRRNDPEKFGLPGGKREEKETLFQTVIRELHEETSLYCHWSHEFFHRVEPAETTEGEDFECYCFYVSEWKGEPKTMEEGNVEWLTTQELTSTKAAFPEYNTRMLAAFRERFPDVVLK